MKIYIPGNLKKIPLVNQFIALLGRYERESVPEDESPEIDPVRRFIELRKSNFPKPDDEGDGEDVRDTMTSYLANNFYYVKGTMRVIDLLGKYNLLKEYNSEGEEIGNSEIQYNGRTLKIDLKGDWELSSYDLFISSLKEFLERLLYYEVFELTVENLILRIEYNPEEGSLGKSEMLYQIDLK